MNKPHPKIRYESQADVLSYELTKEPIDHAEEIGNFIVHFTEDNSPVLVEILNAREFLDSSGSLVHKGSQKSSKLAPVR
ncbi:MAG: DUF2283 domain-containing protein [Patescibacteria group bacterium]